MELTREQGLALLRTYNQESFHLRHAFTVEAVMDWYAHALGYGEEAPFWALAGLLHVEDIATMLNKSPAEVAAMIDLARAQGIIKGYKTLVDWEKAGVNRVEAVIELNVSPKKSRGFDEIAATIASFDEVESVLLMSGGYDLQLVIKGQTFQEIALFVAKRLSPLDDVLSTATHFVLRTYKKEGRLYQDEEIDERECTVL